MTDRKRYIKPAIVNLSGHSAVGGGFLGGSTLLGWCENGWSPTTYTCAAGDRPRQQATACYPVGDAPTMANCNLGGSVVHGCEFGSHAS